MKPETEIREEIALGGDAAAQLRDLSASATAENTVRPTAPPSLWTPSLSDFLFLSLIVWLFLAGPNGWLALLSDGDTGWHVRVGDWIREHGAFPRQDFLSFSKAGEPWFAWEWGSEIYMSYLHQAAGLKGVVLGIGIMIPAYLIVLFRHALWRGASPLIALPVLLIASGSSAIHFLARPHIFTLLFLAASLWLIENERRNPSWRIWLLLPLTVVWANLHGGFLSLVACLGLVAAGSALSLDWAGARRFALLAVGCLAVSVLNPYGVQLHTHIASYLQSDWIREAVDEFQSPSFRSEAMLLFEILLFASLISIYRSVRRGNWADALLVVGWAHLSLGSVRHVPIFLLVAGPIVASELSHWWNELVPGLPKRALLRTFDKLSRDLAPGFVRNSIWVLLPVAVLVLVDRPIPWPTTFPEEKFPVALIEQYRGDIEGKRVLTTDEWGDYLAYRFYPGQRVFFDGRSDFYGEQLGRTYLTLMQGGPAAEEQVERFQFDTVLVPKAWVIHGALRRSGKWEVVNEGKKAILLRRKGGRVGNPF
ncbi:MAG: hypothetical protein JNM66_29755 [Bryobacterales bacterium]|nr:hypothetical protein [Bryobacterales bacterium]